MDGCARLWLTVAERRAAAAQGERCDEEEAQGARRRGGEEEGRVADAVEGGLQGAEFIRDATGGAGEKGGGAVLADFGARETDERVRDSGNGVELREKACGRGRIDVSEDEEQMSADERAEYGPEAGDQRLTRRVSKREATRENVGDDEEDRGFGEAPGGCDGAPTLRGMLVHRR